MLPNDINSLTGFHASFCLPALHTIWMTSGFTNICKRIQTNWHCCYFKVNLILSFVYQCLYLTTSYFFADHNTFTFLNHCFFFLFFFRFHKYKTTGNRAWSRLYTQEPLLLIVHRCERSQAQNEEKQCEIRIKC